MIIPDIYITRSRSLDFLMQSIRPEIRAVAEALAETEEEIELLKIELSRVEEERQGAERRISGLRNSIEALEYEGEILEYELDASIENVARGINNSNVG